ncbi:unnamed protein product (macronuclear) [Paramecium tetraurelia]|uniref:Transmembrane protein n=1 Tax=Paramecium tetraurelia TaxID=5888 RepID=A0DXB9_PARTE|nr:uncharacterized protein GSPATT00021319001 [Paramecium tetraurelia]CAK87686.1 unnamed protein product [Paramecium tetraurelia]|eukprot:XP_001455083.1 hypothetical protein (macronuclear) [Paramecium tetraurelia strain d4-2]
MLRMPQCCQFLMHTSLFITSQYNFVQNYWLKYSKKSQSTNTGTNLYNYRKSFNTSLLSFIFSPYSFNNIDNPNQVLLNYYNQNKRCKLKQCQKCSLSYCSSDILIIIIGRQKVDICKVSSLLIPIKGYSFTSYKISFQLKFFNYLNFGFELSYQSQDQKQLSFQYSYGLFFSSSNSESFLPSISLKKLSYPSMESSEPQFAQSKGSNKSLILLKKEIFQLLLKYY